VTWLGVADDVWLADEECVGDTEVEVLDGLEAVLDAPPLGLEPEYVAADDCIEL
jgi:hypothetical protein